MAEKRTILAAGYYGFGNTGDEAILAAILEDLRKQQKGLRFVVASENPPETMAHHKVESIHWKDVTALHQTAQECDMIILGGGGLFQDYWGVPEGVALTHFHWGISYYSAIGMLAVLYQKPFMIYSVGVGPLLTEEGKRLTRWTFEAADIASVRDAESKDLLVSIGVPGEKIIVTADPVLNTPADMMAAKAILSMQQIDPQAVPIIGVCIRNWEEGGNSRLWKSSLAESLDYFLETHKAQVVFIPLQVHAHALEDDLSVSREVASMMRNENQVKVLPEASSPAVTAGLISCCSLVIGMRLHAVIFATMTKVPTVGLVYDPKVQNFMKSIGLRAYALDLHALDFEHLTRAMEMAWNEQKEIHQILANSMEYNKDRARKNTFLALKLLDKAETKPASMEVLRAIVLQQAEALEKKEEQNQSVSAELHAVSTKLHAARLQLVDLEYLQQELSEIKHSRTWRLAESFRKIRLLFLPIGSRREKFLIFTIQFPKRIAYQSARGTALIRDSIRRHGLPVAIWRGFRILAVRLGHLNKKILSRAKYKSELRQLDEVIANHMGFFDLFHVPMGWNTVLFQRFQHVSLQTAKMGGLALYGGHPIVDRNITVYEKVRDNLYVFDATNREVVQRLFQALQKKPQPRILRVQSIDLVTSGEDVQRFIQQGFTVIYEYIDEISPAITGAVPDLVHQRHVDILKNEDVIVVATSDQLFHEVERHRSRNFILSTNGVDLDHWRIPKNDPPEDLKPACNENLLIGYHGALAKWMDYDLLRLIADQGQYEVVLIGHEHDSSFADSGLKQHPRVHFLGAKSYFELNKYAIHYDIAVLPFKVTNLTQAVSPVKIFEYMAAGKPVVTTNLRECHKYESCLIAKTNNEFLEQLERAAVLRTDIRYLEVLDREARENSWYNRTREILKLAGVTV